MFQSTPDESHISFPASSHRLLRHRQLRRGLDQDVPEDIQCEHISGDASSNLCLQLLRICSGSWQRGLALTLGFLMVFFFFVFPLLIERYDLFSLHEFFQHAEQDHASREKTDSLGNKTLRTKGDK
jgi:hypothetical protein